MTKVHDSEHKNAKDLNKGDCLGPQNSNSCVFCKFQVDVVQQE